MDLDPDTLRTVATELLVALGTDDEAAEVVAASLVEADLRGTGTHGVGLLPLYAEMAADGAIDPSASPAVASRTGNTAIVDGRDAFGQLTGREATAVGVELAAEQGVAAVGTRNGTHLGRLGEWIERAAGEGMVLFAFTNTGGGAQNVAPYGGHRRKLSTNPVAFGFPTFDALDFDVVVDFATSQISGARIREARETDADLHDEWTTTASGDPVADPAAFVDGEGALLPLGGRETGHKGYGLAVVAELLGGLAGGAVAGQRDPNWFSNGATFVVIDPTRFLERSTIEAKVWALADHLRDDDVRLPGEGSHRRAVAAAADGVSVSPDALASLGRLAADTGVTLPDSVRSALDDVVDDGDDVRTW